MKEVFDFLVKVNTYYLATVEGDQPRVRPFGTVNIFENKLYIQAGKKKNVAKQLAVNPKAEISAYDEDSRQWIRLSATLVEDDRIEAQESMLTAYPQLRKLYTAGDGNTAVYYLKDATAVFNSFGEGNSEPKVIKF